MRRSVLVLVAVVLLAAACGSSTKSSSSSSKGVTVEVDAKAPDFNAGALAYFPKAVQVHPGETVTFHNNFSGEPHTITFGTLADAALAAVAKAGPNGPPPPEASKLPDMLPQGPGDANQTAAKECVVASGDLPKNGEGCNGATAPFNGTQAFYNSGYLSPDTTNLKLSLAKDIKPGKYGYYCLIHGPDMSGTVEVVPSATTVPAPDAVAAQAIKERDTELAKLKDAVAALPKGEIPGLVPAVPGQVLAGSGAEASTVSIENFGPQQVKVPVGGTVTWTVIGVHTITFNAPPDAAQLLTKGGDGGWHVNPKAAGPAGGPPVAQNDAQAPGPPKVTDGGSFDGTGFRNTGLVPSFPPALSAYKLTFTKAGTYGYVCLIHPGMTGSVQVG